MTTAGKAASAAAATLLLAGLGASPALAQETGGDFLRQGTAITAKYYEQLDASGASEIGGPISYELCGVDGTGLTAEGVASPGSIFCFQNFESGRITWNQLGGAKIVKGAIYQDWVSSTTELAAGGYLADAKPLSDEITINGGVMQYFALADGGNGVYFWSPETGAHFIDSGTAAGQYFINQLVSGNIAGFPSSEVKQIDSSTSTLTYQDGQITARFTVQGEIELLP